MVDSIFSRQELLYGREGMSRVAEKKVIIFGVGGVGSWCAESLVRSGITHLTIVDSDRVSITNINRQLMATTSTVGQMKVDVLRARLLDINPSADITAVARVYTKETAAEFHLGDYDYIIDAIDSLKDKANLLLEAAKTEAKVFSSMGAALKMNPARIAVAEFWKVKGCPLAAALRRKFKHEGTFPAKKIKCVYSDELLSNKAVSGETDVRKAVINGSIAHATAMFGLHLAALVMMELYNNVESEKWKV